MRERQDPEETRETEEGQTVHGNPAVEVGALGTLDGGAERDALAETGGERLEQVRRLLRQLLLLVLSLARHHTLIHTGGTCVRCQRVKRGEERWERGKEENGTNRKRGIASVTQRTGRTKRT